MFKTATGKHQCRSLKAGHVNFFTPYYTDYPKGKKYHINCKDKIIPALKKDIRPVLTPTYNMLVEQDQRDSFSQWGKPEKM